MSKKRVALALALLLTMGSLTGCWSKREIESGGFATLVAIDKAEGGGIELTVNLAITQAPGNGNDSGGGADAPAWTICATGRNLGEAIASLQTYSGRIPFWFHAEALLIGEDLAREGIAAVLDYILRNREFRLTTWALVTEGKAKDILQLGPKITQLPARYLRDLIDIADEVSVSRPQTLLDLLHKLVSNGGNEAYLPLLRLKPKEHSEGAKATGTADQGGGQENQDKPEATILEGTAVFVGDKMVGKLNGTETRGMLWLRGESLRATVVVEMLGGYVVEQQIYARRTLKLTRAGGQLQATITIFQDGDIREHNIPGSLELNTEAIEQMDAALTEQIKQETQAALTKLQQELGTDTLGIGARVYRLYPALFQAVDWRQAFRTLPIEVVVHANFRRTGEAQQSPLTR